MTDNVDSAKRRFLTTATTVVGAAGVAATSIPFISSMLPSEKAQAAGAPIEVDISKLEAGQRITAEWRGRPIWIVKHTEQTIKQLKANTDKLRDPNSEVTEQQPECCQNPLRSIREDIVVLIGICTHLGCSPVYRPELAPEDLGADWQGGFFCPCHGSKFDLAGRVYQGVPAPTNLQVPPYYYINENKILVGEESKGIA